RRYFHTTAGYQAMMLLGQYHLDHGRPLGAALCFQHVYQSQAAGQFEPGLSLLLASCWLRAGEVEVARKVLAELKRRSPQATFELAGQRVPVYDRDEDALDWLAGVMGKAPRNRAGRAASWLMFRGNPARDAQSEGDLPLLVRPRWSQRVAGDRDSESLLEKSRRHYADERRPALPASVPLALDDLIVMRAPGRLAVVDFRTGKLLWQVDADRPPPGRKEDDSAAGQLEEERLRQQAWIDKTRAALCSDGEQVYVLQDFHHHSDARPRSVIDMRTGQRRLYSGPTYNVLAAYDVQGSQGKRVWSVGGPQDGDQRLAQAFFLGPPLAMQGRLHVIAELEEEVRLVVLEAASGKLLWSQQLAVVPQAIRYLSHRRTGGISPSFAEGVLICPTGVGAVVAVDLTTRSLLWGYQYPNPGEERIFRGGWSRGQQLFPVNVGETWADSCAIISAGRLVITPTESSQMHCLSLSDGSLQWRVDRDRLLYVACLHDNLVVTVGTEKLTAIDLRTGKVAPGWPLALPQDSIPSGRGYHSDSHYYLPLNLAGVGEVVKVRLDKPGIVERSQSRDGTIPGNLISHRGQIVSQNTDRMQVYYQAEPLRAKVAETLQEDPNNVWSLLRRGELLVHGGDMDQAVTHFREAYRHASQQIAAPDPPPNRLVRETGQAQQLEARQLLLASLLENLQHNFAGQRGTIDEIRGLIRSSADQMHFLRVLADGHEQMGEYEEAVISYFDLLDAAGHSRPYISTQRFHTVRLDRWLQARMEHVAGKLSDERGRQLVEDQLQRRQAEALENGSLETLRNFTHFFGGLAAADPVKEALVRQLDSADYEFELVMLLQELARSPQAELRREAVARLAQLFERRRAYREAAHYYHQLRTEFAHEICFAGQTGQQLYDALPATSQIRRPLQHAWPVTKARIVAGSLGKTRDVSYSPASPLFMLSHRHPLRDPLRITIEQHHRLRLAGQDSQGNHSWIVNLQQPGRNHHILMANSGFSCGRSDGPLLVAVIGNQVVAVNTLNLSAGNDGTSILWRQDLTQNPTSHRIHRHTSRRSGEVPPWGDETRRHHKHPQMMARLGPLNAGGVSYIRNRDLICVEPYTGKMVWRYRGVDTHAALFGDEQYVLVAPQDGDDGKIFAATDGTPMGEVTLPPWDARWAYVHRKILTWRRAGILQKKLPQLALYDPLHQKDDWVRKIPTGTKGALIGLDQVALLQRDGRFLVLDLETGQPVIDQMLQPEPTLKGIYLVPSRDFLVLITNNEARTKDRSDESIRYTSWPQHDTASALVTGRMYTLKRETGEPLWPQPAILEQQGLICFQPPELPAVAFARREYRNRKNRVAMSFIDKRTGRLLAPPKDLSNQNNCELACDPEKKVIQAYFQSRGVNFSVQYTDQPVPPGPPLQGPTPHVEETTTIGKWLKAIQKGIQQEDKGDDLFGDF
ncbi:MAG: PQQ-binding-like beta-propeller repeat protein, partial [Planctomycetales bacterium]|nr:PQQ-binding-like beta-propeller repeat protein [Planctomycetales bacterium]